MRIMGIDPGSLHLGWGVLECVGSTMTHVASGTLRAKPGPLFQRLLFLHEALTSALKRYKPDVAAVETMFHGKNSHSVLVLAQARGAVLVALAKQQLCVIEYSPTQVKQAATGRGNSAKPEVHHMVHRLLQLTQNPTISNDQTDALACALCHAQHAPQQARLRMR